MKRFNFILFITIFVLHGQRSQEQTALNFNRSKQYQPPLKEAMFNGFEKNPFYNRASSLQVASVTTDICAGNCPGQITVREPEGTILCNYWKDATQTELVEAGGDDCGNWGPRVWGQCKKFIRAGISSRTCNRTNVYQDKHECYYLPVALGMTGFVTQTHLHGGRYKKTFTWGEEDVEYELCGSWALLPELNDAVATVSSGRELVVNYRAEKNTIVVGSPFKISKIENLPLQMAGIKFYIDGLEVSTGENVLMNSVGEHIVKASVHTKSGGVVKFNLPFYVIKPVTIEEITQKSLDMDNGEIQYTVKIVNNNLDGSNVAWVSTSTISKEGYAAYIDGPTLHNLTPGNSALIPILFRPTKIHRIETDKAEVPISFDVIVSSPTAKGRIIDKKTITVQAPVISTPGGIVGTSGPQKITIIEVKTLSGEVIDVKVPNIIRPGDNITGSVITKTSSSTLEGTVIEIDGKQTNVKNKLFSFLVPAGLSSIGFILKDKNGAELTRTEIPVNVPNLPTPGNNVTIPRNQIPMPPQRSPGNFAPLNYCQPGQPLTINGFFDGNASNTNVSINNIPCEIIAESNRASFANVPPNLPAGRASLTIEEGGVTQTIPIQVITTNLTANKTVMQKNRQATVTATVSGLENMDLNNNNFKIELTNNTPGVIQFRDANSTTITRNINSSNVEKGVFSFTTMITGVSTGSFTINSAISSTTCTECWKQYEKCIAAVEAEEKQCYKDCDKNNGDASCYLACSAAARLKEAECFAQYLGCVRKKMGD